MVPIRTVVAAVPASVSRPTSNSSGSSMGLFYPLLARVQHVTAGQINDARVSQASREQQPSNTESNYQQIPASAVQQQNIANEAASPANIVFEFHQQGTLVVYQLQSICSFTIFLHFILK